MRIRLVRLSGRTPPAPMQAEFGRDGGTIGRAQACDLVLADPSRHISRVQAEIAFVGHCWVLTDRGSALSVIKDGVEIGRHASVPLTDGDALTIGDYEFVVEACRAPRDAPADTRPVAGGPEAADTSPQPPADSTGTRWATPEEIGRTVYAWKIMQAELVDPLGCDVDAGDRVVHRPAPSEWPAVAMAALSDRPSSIDATAPYPRMGRLCEAAAAASPQAAAALRHLEDLPEEQAVQALCAALTRL